MGAPEKIKLTLPPKSPLAERPVTRLMMPDKPTPQELVTKAEDAIEAVFGDTRVSQVDTLTSLQQLREEISTKIAMIEADLEEGGAE